MNDTPIDSLIQLDQTVLHHDVEWVFHRLPKDGVEIPREHVPDPEADPIPATNNKHESADEVLTRWLDTGIDRIRMEGDSAQTLNNLPRL